MMQEKEIAGFALLKIFTKQKRSASGPFEGMEIILIY
jgi:hypothetical protein